MLTCMHACAYHHPRLHGATQLKLLLACPHPMEGYEGENILFPSSRKLISELCSSNNPEATSECRDE
eukprot:1158702-Pelagomonas_calceolata.AAC.8